MPGKYNFYEHRGKKLPEDINGPVIDTIINKLGCPEAAEFVKKFQNNKACGSVQIVDKKNPKHIKISVNWGMVEGYDLIESIETERFFVTALKHIKNDNVDMKKQEKK